MSYFECNQEDKFSVYFFIIQIERNWKQFGRCLVEAYVITCYLGKKTVWFAIQWGRITVYDLFCVISHLVSRVVRGLFCTRLPA